MGRLRKQLLSTGCYYYLSLQDRKYPQTDFDRCLTFYNNHCSIEAPDRQWNSIPGRYILLFHNKLFNRTWYC
jgi:hypothetical protein